MAFNEAQKTAICHKDGTMMVLAGPGSGKTTVITYRIKYLIEKWGVDPSNILVITFTKAAALEMKERFAAFGGQTGKQAAFGTFHAVFFQILRLAYRFQVSDIISEERKSGILRELIQKEKIELEDEKEFLSSIINEISLVKGEMLPLEHYYAKNCSEEVFKRLYNGYEERLRASGLIDFDDMLVMCYELLKKRPDILSAWQKKYRYILIDEFQDINRVQYEIIKMLAEPLRNLFIVGDDDQSIYRFRGAKPEIMLGFEKDYPETKKVLLNINYRSTEEIVRPALRLIEHNEKRFQKEIRTTGTHGKKIVTRMCLNAEKENTKIAEEMMSYIQMGYHYNDIAVLCRTNSGAGMLLEKMMEYHLPFRTKEWIPNLYEHWISKNILSYIKMAMGSRERADFFQIMNRPNRYIGRDYVEFPTVSFEELKACYRDKDWMVERIENLEYDLKALSRMSPLAAVNYIRQGIGYDAYLTEYAEFRRLKAEELFEVADQLKESAAHYKTFEEWFSHMETYGEKLRQQAKEREACPDAVSIVTMHGAKGLEYKIVYIIDANEGVTPHRKAVLDADMEEERRLFYVAMTRAKERLHIYWVKERYHREAEVSRFIEEYSDGE